MNRNALRSQRLLNEAFTKMVSRDETVTVASLCREADINRSTFYSHYETLDDFKSSLERILTDDMIRLTSKVLTARTQEEAREGILRVGRLFGQNVPLYLAVSGSTPDHNAMSFREDLIRDCSATTLADEIRADFVLSSTTAIFHSWAVGLYGEATIDEVSDHVASLVITALGIMS